MKNHPRGENSPYRVTLLACHTEDPFSTMDLQVKLN
jgi:hypothetical protein